MKLTAGAACVLLVALITGCGGKMGHGVGAGQAMAPTIAAGDHFGYAGYGIEPIERFDIVVYTRKPDPRRSIDENTIFVSRVIGLPGETVEIREGKVFINGTELSESSFENVPSSETLPPKKIDDKSYFLLGDNRPNSEDSRYIGPIERGKILGIVSNIIRKADYENGKRW